MDYLIDILKIMQERTTPIKVKFWFRDDDVKTNSLNTEKFTEFLLSENILYSFAAIPYFVNKELGILFSKYENINVIVHGYNHENHATAKVGKSEFPLERLILNSNDLSQGLKLIEENFSQHQIRKIFVPPWNNFNSQNCLDLENLGYKAISCYRNYLPLELNNLKRVDTHIDVINWKVGKVKSIHEIFSELKSLLIEEIYSIGFLTHHLVYFQEQVDLLSQIFHLMRSCDVKNVFIFDEV